MMKGKKRVSVDRLLRRSTLQDHITIDPLQMPAGGQGVEIIKLRSSFRSFDEASPPRPEKHAVTSSADGSAPMQVTDGFATSHPSVSPTPPLTTNSGHDILVTLPNAELVELQPGPSGWYAVLAIDQAGKTAVESFVSTGRRHYKETNLNAGYVSPFSEPLYHETAHARLNVKVCALRAPTRGGWRALSGSLCRADSRKGTCQLRVQVRPPHVLRYRSTAAGSRTPPSRPRTGACSSSPVTRCLTCTRSHSSGRAHRRSISQAIGTTKPSRGRCSTCPTSSSTGASHRPPG